MARAHGSYPWCRGFESPSRYLTGEICRQQIWNLSSAGRASALQAEGHRFEPYRFHILKENGEIAQLARAHGSYPWCRGFESPSRYYTKDESVNRVKVYRLFYVAGIFIQKYTKFLFTIAIIPKILYNAKR